jgi:hypothetical protein
MKKGISVISKSHMVHNHRAAARGRNLIYPSLS